MPITYKNIETIPEFIDAIRLRSDVFIIEQKFQPGWEPDEDDKKAVHFVGIDKGKIIATVRFRKFGKDEYKIERMAVAKNYRKKGIGRELLEYVIRHLKKLKAKKIWLRSQANAKTFYDRCGFIATTKPFEIYRVMHIDMEYTK